MKALIPLSAGGLLVLAWPLALLALLLSSIVWLLRCRFDFSVITFEASPHS